jgi:hypothetical protein
MIVYGVISYILIIAMIVGYILVKRWGDNEEKKYNDFRDETANKNVGDTLNS